MGNTDTYHSIACPSTSLCWAGDGAGQQDEYYDTASPPTIISATAPAYSDTLTGLNQTLTNGASSVDIATNGWTTGWSVWLTSSLFCTASCTQSANIPQTGTLTSDTCDTTCTTAVDTVGYPYSLPEGSGPPTATKLFNASSGSGEGNQTINFDWTANIPANIPAGNFSTTWTYTISSTP